MKYRQLADTGVFVSELCLGAMTFGGAGQMWEVIGGLGQTDVDALVHRALDAGINFIDTANVYSAGESETMLGIAQAHGASVPQIALAWILANDAVTSVIIGARKQSQLDDNLQAVDVTLTADDLKALGEVSALPPAYPQWMDSLGSDRRPGERRY